jgi:hypothetical protein
LLVVVALAIIESFDIGLLDHPAWRHQWPFFLFGLLALFLSLQLLRLLFPK